MHLPKKALPLHPQEVKIADKREKILLPLFFKVIYMLTQEVQQTIESIINTANPDVYVVEMAFHKGGSSVLLIRIDTDNGVMLEECIVLNRKIGKYLEESEVFDFEYNLEVTSPGVGEPLLLPRQYQKEIGHRLRVLMNPDGMVVEGELTQANEQDFTLKLDLKKRKKADKSIVETEKIILFSDIKEAKVVFL